ncbi:hypothetical protein ACLK1T_15825 [Escherichia coli]
MNAQLLQQANRLSISAEQNLLVQYRNTDRSVGASLSGYIAGTHGDQGWQPILSKRTSTAPQARASACQTRAAWNCT